MPSGGNDKTSTDHKPISNRFQAVVMIHSKRLLLASASPRRRELLSSLDFDIEIVKLHNVDENYPTTLHPTEVPEYLSRKKSESYDTSRLQDNEVLVTADTVVILDDEVIGKPADSEDAKIMLSKLSGRTHLVITGVTLATHSRRLSFSTRTEVTFDHLSPESIEHYVYKYKPLDKAGSYGIQEWIGYIGVTGINGCYYNVMGLPLHDLYRHLALLDK